MTTTVGETPVALGEVIQTATTSTSTTVTYSTATGFSSIPSVPYYNVYAPSTIPPRSMSYPSPYYSPGWPHVENQQAPWLAQPALGTGVVPTPAPPAATANLTPQSPISPNVAAIGNSLNADLATPVFTDRECLKVLNSLPSYSGQEDLEQFLLQICVARDVYKWNDIQIAVAIKFKLTGNASKLYYAIPFYKRPNTGENIVNWLKTQFGKSNKATGDINTFRKLIGNKGETLQNFAQRLEAEAESIYPSLALAGPEGMRQQFARDSLIINQFLNGISTRLANEICRIKQFNTVEEALPCAEYCEQALSRFVKQTYADSIRYPIRTLNTEDNLIDEVAQQRDKPRNQVKKDDKQIYRGADYPKMRGRCYNCGNKNHSYRECTKPKQIFCYECIIPGHRATAKDCPLNAKTVSPPTQEETA